MSSQKGAVLLLLTITLPFLLCFVILAGTLSAATLEHARKLHLCRTVALAATRRIENGILDLFSLNKEARTLMEKQEEANEIAKSGGASPVAGMTILAYKAYLFAQQLKLRGEQQGILSQTEQEAKALIKDLEISLKNTHFQSYDNSVLVYYNSTSPKVLRKQLFEVAPEYQRMPLFSQAQNLSIDIQYSLSSALPSWVKHSNFIKLEKTLNISCAATLKKESKKWVPNLTTKGKYLSKWLSELPFLSL